MDVQTLLWVVAAILFAVGAVMAGTARAMIQCLGLAGLCALTVGLLVPLL